MSNELVVPEEVELECLLIEIRKICWIAADVLRAYARGSQPPYGFPKALTVQEGGDGPVSTADIAINELLISGLCEKFPLVKWDILSEESAKEKNLKKSQSDCDWKWILDPLDGTRDFLQGSENYAVHLALAHKKNPKIGIILIPERNELWFGIIGMGAWYEDQEGVKKSVSFSQRTEISELINVASKNHQEQILQNLLEQIKFRQTKNIGSVGCKVATILRGESDVYISLSGKTSPKDWDMAAPHAVIEAAGGLFTHADGRCLCYQKLDNSQRGCLVASHGKSHKIICEKIMRFFSVYKSDYLV
tara:strand:+ start:42170 stop:43084 length:915 start_codon:yes stop_codon:yes gene_type:complete